jgi:hypothetical protein
LLVYDIDPKTHANAGDIFTAHELALSLVRMFTKNSWDLNMIFLRKGKDWYDSSLLQQIDVLIVLLDSYDISKTLSSIDKDYSYDHADPLELNLPTSDSALYSQAKPNLIIIAWMRNWFQRWLTHPWIGNYDLLLVSSDLAKDFFLDYSSRFNGFQTTCMMNCPHDQDFEVLSLNQSMGKSLKPESSIQSKSGRRMHVPVAVLRIATNAARFSPGKGSDEFEADYGFTGSYHAAHRRIMDFDPSSLKQWKGIVVGAGWDASVSKGWHSISRGMAPYSSIPSVSISVFYYCSMHND